MSWFNVGAAAISVVGGIAAKNKAKKAAEKQRQEQEAKAAAGGGGGPPIPVDNIGLWGGKQRTAQDPNQPQIQGNFDPAAYLAANPDVQGTNYGGGQWADDPQTQAWEHFQEAGRIAPGTRNWSGVQTQLANEAPTNWMGGGGFKAGSGPSQSQHDFNNYMGTMGMNGPLGRGPAPGMGGGGGSGPMAPGANVGQGTVNFGDGLQGQFRQPPPGGWPKMGGLLTPNSGGNAPNPGMDVGMIGGPRQLQFQTPGGLTPYQSQLDVGMIGGGRGGMSLVRMQ